MAVLGEMFLRGCFTEDFRDIVKLNEYYFVSIEGFCHDTNISMRFA